MGMGFPPPTYVMWKNYSKYVTESAPRGVYCLGVNYPRPQPGVIHIRFDGPGNKIKSININYTQFFS